jgi:stage II sporulation protein M
MPKLNTFGIKMNSAAIINHYQQIRRDLHEVRKYIFAAIVIFAAGIILAIVIPSLGESVISAFLGYFKTFENKNVLELVVAIFLRNAFSAFFAILFGFLFGLVPAFGAAFNGIAVGAIVKLNPLNFFKIIPHGLFELPAMFITWGLGIWCAGGLFHAPGFKTITFRVKRSLNIYLSIIVPLLIIAAIIEVLGITILFGT